MRGFSRASWLHVFPAQTGMQSYLLRHRYVSVATLVLGLVFCTNSYATITAPATSTGNYTVSWTPQGGQWTSLSESGSSNTSYTVYGNSHTFTNKPSGTYTYRVQGCRQDDFLGVLCYPALDPPVTVVVTSIPPPGAPGPITGPATSVTAAFTLAWGAASGSVGWYDVLEQPTGRTLSPSTNTVGITVGGSGSYSYQVRACNSGGCSGWTAGHAIQVRLPPPLPGQPATDPANTTGSYFVIFTVGNVATLAHQLEEQTNGGAFSQAPGTRGTQEGYGGWIVSQAISGKGSGTYGYRARSCHADAMWSCSEWTSVANVQVTLPPGVPGPINGPSTSLDGAFTLTWGAASGSVATYRLEEMTPGGVYAVVQNTAATTFAATGKPDNIYSYRVSACNASCSVPTAVKTVQVARPPGITPPPSLSAPTTPGSMPYGAGIDSDGLAQISVPVAAPPGVNGLQPALAINFDSGDYAHRKEEALLESTLGYGWRVDGLSSIRRCSNRISSAAAVALNANDRLCLDGHLLKVTSGTYWAVGSEYRTENETFTRITAMGTAGNLWFEVSMADGRILKYGTAEAKATLANVDYVWAVKEEKDRFGNVMTYTYNSASANAELYPDRISYGGTEVSFKYALRPAASRPSTTIAGYPVTRSVYLHTIRVAVGALAVRDYRLISADQNNQTRLQNIQLCGYDEYGGGESCMGGLSFSWFVSGTRLAVDGVFDALGAATQFTYGTALAEDPVTPDFHGLTTACSLSDYLNGSSANPNLRLYARSMGKSNGLGGTSMYRVLRSAAPRFSLDGRGYVGHQGTLVIDDQKGFHSYIHKWQCFPFIAAEAATYVYTGPVATGQLLARSERLWASTALNASATRFAFVQRATDLSYEGGVMFGVTETANTYVYQNDVPQQLTVTTRTANTATVSGASWSLAGLQKTHQTTLQFTNATASWLIGFVNRSDVSHSGVPGAANGDPIVSTFTQRPGTLAIATETRYPGTDLQLVTSYQYDANGNFTSIGISGTDITSRETRFYSYADNRYPGNITNAVGHQQLFLYDRRFGLSYSLTDPNGLVTNVKRDPFGRVTRQDYPDGRNTTISYQDCLVAACPAAVGSHVPSYRVEAVENSGARRIVFFDELNRTIREQTIAFDGTLSTVDTWYDAHGRVQRRSLPYFTAPVYVIHAYDLRDRPTSETRPDGGSTTLSYALNSVSAPTRLNITQTETVVTSGSVNETQRRLTQFNALGQMTLARDASGTSKSVDATYSYDTYGNLRLTRVNGNTATDTTMVFDRAGNRRSISEPNTGTTTFTPDALGQVRYATDAAGRTTQFNYDILSRPSTQVDNYGTVNATTTTWSYDAVWAIGKLGAIQAPGYQQILQYDSLSRPTRITLQVTYEGGTQHLIANWTYDAYGRLENMTYPSGYETKRVYNAAGYLAEIRERSSNALLHKINTRNAFGQVTGEQFGNGLATTTTHDPGSGRVTGIATTNAVQSLTYLWRSNGHLKRRTQPGVMEGFGYDGLNRLKSAATTSSPSRTLTTDYDLLGNVSYKQSNLAGDANVSGYTYGARPHAVTQATVNGVNHALTYDAVGNVTAITPASGLPRSFAYDIRNRTTRVTLGPTANPESEDRFAYDVNGNRYYKKSTYKVSGVILTSHTFYLLGGAFERTLPPSQSGIAQIEKSSLDGIVQHTRTALTNNSVTSELLYLHRDHLGSVDAISNAAGAVVTRMSFDPFGARRMPDWSGGLTVPARQEILDNADKRSRRGFTDHEHLDRTGVIHMNGRIYDPLFGRFLSADPMVQAPHLSQGFNRYAYTFNSPLSYVDPSGFQNYSCNDPNGTCTDVGSAVWGTEVESRRAHGAGARPYLNFTVDSHTYRTTQIPLGLGFERASTVGGFAFGQAQQTRNGMPYLVNQEPQELLNLRSANPRWRALEQELWEKSLPNSFGLFLQQRLPFLAGFGGAREHALLVFQSVSDPKDIAYRTFVGSGNTVTGSFSVPGYRLLAMFHTHPFVYDENSYYGGKRGPSDTLDADTARRYPWAYFYIRALGPVDQPFPGEWYYYGPRALAGAP